MDAIIVRENAPGQFEELPFGQSIVNGDVMHPWQVVDLWTDAELAAEKVYRATRAFVPADKIATGYHFERNGSQVVQVYELVDAPASTVDELKDYLAQVRFEKEVAGMVSQTYGPLLTDRDTRAIVAQSIQSIDLGIVQAPIMWKAPGGFVSLSRADFVGIATEMAAHVQGTFDKEAAVSAQIDAGEISTKAGVLAAFNGD